MDVPKSLASLSACTARMGALDQPHVATLAAFVNRLRQQTGHADGVPDFDPMDGGVQAECLFLLEAPGAKAKRSGFISRNNPDETARNFFLLNQESGLPRERTVTWNVVPWYVGSDTKIRAVTRADIKLSESYLTELISLLPALRVIVLVGRKAQLARRSIERLAPHCVLFECPHPSPLALNGRPERRSHILHCLKEVAAHLGMAATLSIERTSSSGLRPLPAAAHVKR